MTCEPIEVKGTYLALVHRLPAEPVRLVWCEWLRRHSIDPSDVTVPGAIVRLPTSRRVSYRSVERDEKGRPMWEDYAAGTIRRVTRIVQLEAAPAPFPEVTS